LPELVQHTRFTEMEPDVRKYEIGATSQNREPLDQTGTGMVSPVMKEPRTPTDLPRTSFHRAIPGYEEVGPP
jgi:hypothetical protein